MTQPESMTADISAGIFVNIALPYFVVLVVLVTFAKQTQCQTHKVLFYINFWQIRLIQNNRKTTKLAIFTTI